MNSVDFQPLLLLYTALAHSSSYRIRLHIKIDRPVTVPEPTNYLEWYSVGVQTQTLSPSSPQTTSNVPPKAMQLHYVRLRGYESEEL